MYGKQIAQGSAGIFAKRHVVAEIEVHADPLAADRFSQAACSAERQPLWFSMPSGIRCLRRMGSASAIDFLAALEVLP